MKKLLPFLISLLLLPVALSGQKAYRVQDIPNVQLTDKARFVSNPDGILSADAVYRIDTMLYSLKQSGKAQVAVIAVNSIGSADPFDFLLSLLRTWGVGDARENNGLGILLVIDQGAIEIQTGYGVEGDLPDAIVKRVINNYMLPAFRDRDWDKGMIDGVSVLSEVLNGRPPADVESDNEDIAILIVLVILFFGLPILILIIGMIFANRCPKCHKQKLQRVSSQVVSRTKTQTTEEITYVCQNCGHIVKRKRVNNHGGPGAGGMIIGGMGGFGGGSSRGGGGGSWGGGSFGGGGARGRF